MANKTIRIDERYQIRAGQDGALLFTKDGKPSWGLPSEGGIATETYADQVATQALTDANEYTDTKHSEAIGYTNDEVDLAKEAMQNYTDDEVFGAVNDLEGQLALKADLVGGRVPASQLPAFADTFEVYPNLAAFPSSGGSNILYIAEDTNKAYRWTGAAYTQIGESLILGETSSTAYRGDRGKTAYDHTLLTNNPHQVNKTQVGLSNVDNTSDANKPVSTATATALSGKANTVHTHVISDVTGLDSALNGKEPTMAKGNLVAGPNITLAGTLANRLVGAGDVTITASDAPVAPVVSVNGKVGAVTVTKSDVSLANVDNTSDATKNSATATLTNKTIVTPTINNYVDIKSSTAGQPSIRVNNSGLVTGVSPASADSLYSGASVSADTKVLTSANTQTVKNKRIQPRVSSTSSGNITPNMAADLYVLTSMAADSTIGAPTGTPVDGEKIMFRFKDNGTARALTWNAIYVPVGVFIPTTTVADKWLYVGAVYNAASLKWDVIAVSQEV